ncbi:MAG: hypothetical protein PVG20_02265 [Thioalkalispiraceae bacterium]|jgi:hypothetical protein
MSDYSTDIKPIAGLDNNLRQQVVDLYLNYYAGSSASKVLSDLEAKTEILLLFYQGKLVGFTSLLVYSRHWQGEQIRIVYSGDTVVAREHWGQQALAFAWITRMGELKSEKPDSPLYWFVIIKGHRTFKYLPTFGKSFHPHWSEARPDLKLLADTLAEEKFGSEYNKATGIVEFLNSQGHLREEIAYPTEEEMTKESVQFFLKANPNYLQGHELVCLCELEEQNMKPLTKRIFRKACNDKLMATTV